MPPPTVYNALSGSNHSRQLFSVASLISTDQTEDNGSFLRRRDETYHSLPVSPDEELDELTHIKTNLCSSLSRIHRSSFVIEGDEASRITPIIESAQKKPGPLSQFFICHLPLLLETDTRERGIANMQGTLSIFSNAVSVCEIEKMTGEERLLVLHAHERCVNFAKSLRWALHDLKIKQAQNRSELKTMKCIKTVFTVVISLHLREQECFENHRRERFRRPGHSGFLYPGSLLTYSNVNARETYPKVPSQDEKLERNPPLIPGNQAFANVSNDRVGLLEESIANQPLALPGGREPLSCDHVLVTMFQSHMVPMTPVVARSNGRYVRVTVNSELIIMDAAYICENQDGECFVPCNFILNKTYTPESKFSPQGPRYLTYVGFIYPDGTMLSYIPIHYARLVYENGPANQPILRNGSTTFAFLHMDLPNSVYQTLKRLAKEVYLQHNPEVLFVDHFEELQRDGRTVRIEVLVKSERTVRIEDRERSLDYPVLQALLRCGHDLCGKSLIHLRFTTTKRGSQRMQLRLIVFGMIIKRSPLNYNDVLFDLLGAPSGPMQSLLSS